MMLASWALFSASIHVSLVQTEHNRPVGSMLPDSELMYSSLGLACVSDSGSKVRCHALDDFGCSSSRAPSVVMKSCAHGLKQAVVGKTCSFEPMDWVK